MMALGGLMLPMLVKSGYSGRFSLGLVTASGSIGLLFPPSLVVLVLVVLLVTCVSALSLIFAEGGK